MTGPDRRAPKRVHPVLAIVGAIIAGGLMLSQCDKHNDASGPATPTSSTPTPAGAPTTPPETFSPQEIQQMEAQRLDPSTYSPISFHDYAVLLKNPDAHVGEKIIIYGKVTQFDPATGSSEFRATTVAAPHPPSDDDEYNALIEAGDPSIVANVVSGDNVRMYVVVAGTETYKSALGANLTVPKFNLNIINVTPSQ